MKTILHKLFFILIFVTGFQSNGSGQWILKNNFGPNGEFYDVHFLDESNGFAVGRDGIAPNYFGIIEKTNDGGDTWTSLNVGSAPILFEVAFIDSLIGFAVGDSGTIIKTIDAGLNWTPIVSGTTNRLQSIFFSSPTIGYICGTDIILKTIDSGNSWTSIFLNGTFLSTKFTTIDTGFVVGIIPNPVFGPPLSTFILKTTDGGQSWISKFDVSSTTLRCIQFVSPSIGYAFGDLTQLKTIDAGETWNALPFPTATAVFGVHFPDQITGYAVGIDYTTGQGPLIAKTTDAGATWVKQNVSTAVWLFDVQFINSTIGYAVGARGGVGYEVHKTINGGVSTSVNEFSEDDNFTTFFPNPSTGNFSFQFKVVPKKLKIYNSLGLLMIEENLSETEFQMNMSNFSSGIYFYKVEYNNHTSSGKINLNASSGF
ncbi:MAG: T9SS type A sorting domain-containing protein [Bacteroidia bacterium]|nr:T9SS type A sorting domain-containing protein [Bacteroidia bacterium]